MFVAAAGPLVAPVVSLLPPKFLSVVALLHLDSVVVAAADAAAVGLADHTSWKVEAPGSECLVGERIP